MKSDLVEPSRTALRTIDGDQLTAAISPEEPTADSTTLQNLTRVFLAHTRQDSANPRGGPGGHLEPTDTTLVGAALRELSEETGIDPEQVVPVSMHPAYVEFGQVPARPAKDEPDHYHLDIGYAFATADAEVGRIQESEVTGAAWYPLEVAERLVGPRIARAVTTSTGIR